MSKEKGKPDFPAVVPAMLPCGSYISQRTPKAPCRGCRGASCACAKASPTPCFAGTHMSPGIALRQNANAANINRGFVETNKQSVRLHRQQRASVA